MIVCVCNRVSDRDIARHVRGGMSFDDIQLELGVATQCGRCEGCARQVVDQCSASHPTAALRHAADASGRAAPACAPQPAASEAVVSWPSASSRLAAA